MDGKEDRETDERESDGQEQRHGTVVVSDAEMMKKERRGKFARGRGLGNQKV